MGVKLIGAAIAVLSLTACGGGGDGAAGQETVPAGQTRRGAPPSVEALSGDWVRIGSKLLVRFGDDGTFAMDYENGDLDRPSAAIGTYELAGSTVTFENEGPGFCPAGGTWVWDVRVVEEDLHVVWTDGGCTIETGTAWRLTRRLIQPA